MSLLIHFDKGSFLIKCPYHANELVQGMPSVRWSKAHGAWRAPITRHNVKHLVEVLRPAAQFTQDAQDAIHNYSERQKERNLIKTGFPHWYKFKTDPMAHQRRCLEHLYPKSEAAMFMDMGTGKTKAAIDFNAALRMEGLSDGWLIVCKLSLRQNWVEEIQLHCPIPYSVHLPDTTREKEYKKWLNQNHDMPILIVGLESLSAGRMITIAEHFVKVGLKRSMTVDESSLIAGHKAARSERCVELGRECQYRQALTGTPVAENPMNLYMQFEYLDPNIIGIGDFYAFRNRYAVMGGYRDPKSGNPLQIVGYQNINELTQTIAPWTFQVKKEDVLDLPPKRFQVRTVQLTKEQRELYNIIKKDAAYAVDDREVSLANVLEKFLRLHQICGGWIGEMYEDEGPGGKVVRKSRLNKVVGYTDNPKIKELIDILEEAGSKQVIIWCAHRHEIRDVALAIKSKDKFGVLAEMHGDIDEGDRQKITKEFQDGKVQYLISNAATGSMGFTWTAAEVVVYYSNTQKLVDRQQSEDRAHRKGQTKSVLYIDIVCEKTVDVVYLKSLKEKKDVADFVRDRLGHAQSLLEGIDS